MGRNKHKNREAAMEPEIISEDTPSVDITIFTEMKKEPENMSEQPIVKQTTNVDKLTKLTNQFDAAYEAKEATIGSLISICNYLNTTNDPKVFSEFYTWFSRRTETSMHDTTALRGIHTIQNNKTKTRVEATHQCFVELIRVLRSRPRGHYRFTVRAMQAMMISENLAHWILQRATM